MWCHTHRYLVFCPFSSIMEYDYVFNNFFVVLKQTGSQLKTVRSNQKETVIHFPVCLKISSKYHSSLFYVLLIHLVYN